jgi:hypothetical protein
MLTRPVKRKGGQGLSELACTSVKIELFDALGMDRLAAGCDVGSRPS